MRLRYKKIVSTSIVPIFAGCDIDSKQLAPATASDMEFLVNQILTNSPSLEFRVSNSKKESWSLTITPGLDDIQLSRVPATRYPAGIEPAPDNALVLKSSVHAETECPDSVDRLLLLLDSLSVAEEPFS